MSLKPFWKSFQCLSTSKASNYTQIVGFIQIMLKSSIIFQIIFCHLFIRKQKTKNLANIEFSKNVMFFCFFFSLFKNCFSVMIKIISLIYTISFVSLQCSISIKKGFRISKNKDFLFGYNVIFILKCYF